MSLIKRKKIQLDEELFKKISEGDKEAFRELYYSTQKQVFTFLLSLTRNYHDAEDLMQDTYLKVRNASYLYKAGYDRMSWIFKIAQNEFISRYRHENHFKMEAYEDYENEITDSGIAESEDKIFIEWVLNELDEEERKIVLLHIVSGMKHREIGQLLNLNTATVITKYNRSIKRIKKHLDKEVLL